MNNPQPTQPPKHIDYPVYTEQQRQDALLSVCRFLLQHRKERLAREAKEAQLVKEGGADNESSPTTA